MLGLEKQADRGEVGDSHWGGGVRGYLRKKGAYKERGPELYAAAVVVVPALEITFRCWVKLAASEAPRHYGPQQKKNAAKIAI